MAHQARHARLQRLILLLVALVFLGAVWSNIQVRETVCAELSGHLTMCERLPGCTVTRLKPAIPESVFCAAGPIR